MKLRWGNDAGAKAARSGRRNRLGVRPMAIFALCAGALGCRDAEKGRAYANGWAGARPRLWRLARDAGGRKARSERPRRLVTVGRPTHFFEITRAFLEAGFHVLWEKADDHESRRRGDRARREGSADGSARSITALAPIRMVREMRAHGGPTGQIGRVRPRGERNSATAHHGDATDAREPAACAGATIRRMAGVSGQFADCGIHAPAHGGLHHRRSVEQGLGRFPSTPEPCPGRRRDGEFPHVRRHRRGALEPRRSPSGASKRSTSRRRREPANRWAVGAAEPGLLHALGGRTQIMEKGEAGA